MGTTHRVSLCISTRNRDTSNIRNFFLCSKTFQNKCITCTRFKPMKDFRWTVVTMQLQGYRTSRMTGIAAPNHGSPPSLKRRCVYFCVSALWHLAYRVSLRTMHCVTYRIVACTVQPPACIPMLSSATQVFFCKLLPEKGSPCQAGWVQKCCPCLPCLACKKTLDVIPLYKSSRKGCHVAPFLY